MNESERTLEQLHQARYELEEYNRRVRIASMLRKMEAKRRVQDKLYAKAGICPHCHIYRPLGNKCECEM